MATELLSFVFVLIPFHLLHIQISHRADGRNHHRLHNVAIFQIMMMEHHCGHHLYVFIYMMSLYVFEYFIITTICIFFISFELTNEMLAFMIRILNWNKNWKKLCFNVFDTTATSPTAAKSTANRSTAATTTGAIATKSWMAKRWPKLMGWTRCR